MIHVFDCGGPDAPPVCYNGNDVEIGIPVTKNPDGTFTVTLNEPLREGQLIYVTDGCFDPLLFGPSAPVLVLGPVPAPTLSPQLIAAVAAVLAMVGMLGIRRMRRASR